LSQFLFDRAYFTLQMLEVLLTVLFELCAEHISGVSDFINVLIVVLFDVVVTPVGVLLHFELEGAHLVPTDFRFK